MGVEVATIEAAQAGDPVAIAALVDEFTPTVVGAAYGLCGDVQQAGDIAQEVFATMLVRLRDLREPAALPGWLMAVTRSVARRQRRSAPRAALHSSEPDPEEVVLDRDVARRVRRSVEDLPADERLLVALHYFAGHRLSEIAELCDLPLSTVKKRMRVARGRMRGRIEMNDDLARAVSPDPSDVIRMYTAMRSGDVGRVARLLDARPELVDVRERWTRVESIAHRLAGATGGTPLLRAVERGDEAMVRLLLESGAAPEVTAFAGTSPLDVAKMRGFEDVEALLRAAGAPETAAPTVEEDVVLAAEETGIKVIDLWCPLPGAGLVHLTPGFGLGAVVLIAELSCRAARRGRRVVWTGFVPAPTDLLDMHHGIADAGLADDVELSVAPPDAPAAAQVARLDEGIRWAGDDAFLVVFTESGHQQSIEERLLALSHRAAVTLVVGPFDGSALPPKPHGSPYRASIVFDAERARRHRWPAVGSASWSKAADPAMHALAERARRDMSDELDAYLAQRFFVAEHVTGRPGETVTVDEMRGRVSALMPRAL
jgi:RNA polymerase sigma factor (sigma-70 family)